MYMYVFAAQIESKCTYYIEGPGRLTAIEFVSQEFS